MTNIADLSRIKLAMIHQLDATLRQNHHQSLVEVLNELRMRSVVSQPDPSPDKVFSVILQTHILAYKPTPSVLRMREALERMTSGTFGLCVRCGRDIPVELLLRDPTLSRCALCHGKANS